jgi:3-methylfumaryl-CoA hydratase
MSVEATADPAILSQWIARREVRTAVIHREPVAMMNATLDRDPENPPGFLPPGWQWLFFNAVAPASQLGDDGHPRRGGFLPPVALPRRMWAGGTLSFHRPIPLGATVERRSTIADVTVKEGRTGKLVFVAVDHGFFIDGTLHLEERHDIVYREPPRPGMTVPPPSLPAVLASWMCPWNPDATQLFRYSALTFNGHRIHYDHPYVTEVEGYAGLVAHGPLAATLLMDLAETSSKASLRWFQFRGLNPMIAGQALTLCGQPTSAQEASLWILGPDGRRCMEATARFG